MNFLYALHKNISNPIEPGQMFHLFVNIITFVEDCPVSVFPIYYKYETSLSQQESQLYKGKPAIEKGWVVYDSLFCNLGRNLKSIIKSEEDFSRNESRIKTEETPFLKYIPSQEEVNELLGNSFISLEKFNNFYIDMIDIELDEDVIWPYHWPINV